MLILLPPSEGKTPAAPRLDGPARTLDLAELAFSSLLTTREDVAAALVRLCAGPAARARRVLGISERQDGERARNAALMSQPTAPAGEVYTGVLYDALGLATLTATARRRAGADVAIASALFGLLRVTDRIPAYRLSADTMLPGAGRLTSVWRDPVSAAIAGTAGRGVILDLRSSAYVALGPVPPDLAERTAVARVLQEKAGRRTVVSHHNKATKGRLVRSLLGVPRPRTVPDLALAIGEAGYPAEVSPPRRDGDPWCIDVIVREL